VAGVCSLSGRGPAHGTHRGRRGGDDIPLGTPAGGKRPVGAVATLSTRGRGLPAALWAHTGRGCAASRSRRTATGSRHLGRGPSARLCALYPAGRVGGPVAGRRL